MCGPCLFYTGSLTSKSFKWRKERPSECELCPPAFFTVKMPLLCRDLGMEKTFKQLCFARARCKLEIGKYLSILREWSTFMFFPTSYSVSQSNYWTSIHGHWLLLKKILKCHLRLRAIEYNWVSNKSKRAIGDGLEGPQRG